MIMKDGHKESVVRSLVPLGFSVRNSDGVYQVFDRFENYGQIMLLFHK